MPPILLMKRTLDDLEDLDDFDDFDETDDEEELLEPHPKRLRDKSPLAEEQDEREDESKDQDNQTEEKDVADRVVELMMPRMEAQMQQLVNSSALRMLDVLGQKLARLESCMDEMHNEWKKGSGITDLKRQPAVPQYQFGTRHQSAVQQYFGRTQAPPITALNAWRWKDNKEGVYYSMRRVVIDEIQARVEARCPNATGATGDVWIAVCEEMDAERSNLQFTLNQYIFELKRRDKPVPVPGTKKWDPEDPHPPPAPVLSRSTPSVQKLWTEWFSGKMNHNGYATFPSIIQLNHKFGNTWRHSHTPEYNIYLKRRCIIDIALRRIVEIGGDRTETTKKVLKMMDAERLAHNLSLVQYHAWAREKYGHHASTRTHLPKFVADLGEGPEEAIELEARTRSQQDEEDGIVRDHSTDIDKAILGHERQSESRSGQGQESSVPPSPASLG
ncbi:unnamed protein product [Aureobasidium uvarum]|uniref:Transcription activator GCR1-like domain-containing protein n=1 Tax=Aureobasidium uvarum TaxID=2773716 RepID=A0A9N8K923_9PEZI|nr:unnamed protein product [Aureobasidium uvarum]